MEVVSIDGCDICGADHNTVVCPELGLDQTNVEFSQLSTRARLTLPSFVQVVDNGSGLVGVVAKATIKKKTQMGPYEAKRTTHIFEDLGFFTLKLIGKDGSTVCLDTTDENECNWLCLVRAALTASAQNCMAYQLGANIFYNTTRDILEGEELQVWYAPNFARKLSKPTMPDGETRVLLGHRIEPLTSELVLEASGVATDDVAAAASDHEDGDSSIIQDSVELTRGEIRRAIYCPRCGNTFKSQSEMVHHLREHVMNTVYKDTPHGRRGPGRPRKHPGKPQVLKSSTKRGRGRPRKSDRPICADDEDSNEGKVSGMKRKLDELDDSTAEEEDDEEDLEVKSLKIDNGSDSDRDYTCIMAMTTSSQRVQPSRRRKGRHSKYLDDFVMSTLGRKIKDEKVENTDKLKSDNSLSEDRYEDKSSVAAAKHAGVKKSDVERMGKRGRGRPRKAIVRNVQHCEKAEVKSTKAGDTLGPDQIKAAVKALEKGADGNENKEATDITTDVSEVTEDDVKSEETNIENKTVARNDNEDDDAGGKESCRIKDNEEDLVEEPENISKDDNDDSKIGANDSFDEEAEMDSIAEDNEMDSIAEDNEIDSIAEDNEIDSIAEDNEIDSIAEGKEMDSFVEGNEINSDPNNTDLGKESDTKVEEGMADKVEEEMTDKVEEEMADKVEEGMADKVEEGMPAGGFKESDKSTLLTMFEEGGEKLYCCILCEERFSQEVEAIAHFMGHKNGWRTCKTCQKHFDSAEELEKHVGECDAKESYSCDICQQSFKSAHYLYRHMIMHTDLFNCVKCKKTFSRKDSLQKHVLKCCPYLADSYKIHSCEVCNRVFSTLSGKMKHVKKCASMKCEECKKVFSSAELHKMHDCKGLETDENMIGKYSCGKCSRSFQSMYYLKQHEALHEKHHVCEKCGKNLMTKEDLEGHQPLCVTLETIKSVGWGTCDKCGKVFNNQKIFRDHYLSHTHPYACGQCNKRFIKVGTLTSHSCGSDKGHECPYCNKKFKTQSSLERHDIERGCMRYECSACGQQFHMKKDANLHQCESSTEETPATIVYLTDMKEVCPVCGKSFSTRSNLTKHMVLHGDKTLQCPHCPKRFHLEVYLKEHITCVHYNVYKFQCTGCGKMLKSKTALLSHTRLFHMDNIEMYGCETCGKMFKQKGNLRTHMYSHSNERKFKCELCVRTFKYPDQLSKHRTEHGDGKRLSCDQCEKQFHRGYELKKHQQVYHSGNIYVCGVCSARCGHRHTLVRHYKRKHVDEYPLVLQEGYLNTLLKHSSELRPPSPHGQGSLVDVNNDGEYVLLLSKDEKKESASQTPENGDSSVKSSPQRAAEALQSLALGNFTPKQFEMLKDKGILIKEDGSLVNPAFSLMEDYEGIVMPPKETTDAIATSILPQEGAVSEPTEDRNISLPQANNALQMVQNADGTISVNTLQGMTQTIEGLEGMEGQIVILQIVDPDMQDGSGGEILRGEVIQQVQTQEVETIDDQGATVLVTHEGTVDHGPTLLVEPEEGEGVEEKAVPSEISIQLATQTAVLARHEEVEEKAVVVPSEISIQLATQTAELQEQIDTTTQGVFTAVKLEKNEQALVVKNEDADKTTTEDDGEKIAEASTVVEEKEVAGSSFDVDIDSPGLVVVTDGTEIRSEEENPLIIIEAKPIDIELEQGLSNLSSIGTGTAGLQLVSGGHVGGEQVVEIGMVGDDGVQPVTVETVVVEKSIEGLVEEEEELDIVMENL